MFWRLVILLCVFAASAYAAGVPVKATTSPSAFTCPTEYGLYPDPDNCHDFYECNEFIPFHFTCPEDLGFDDAAHECNYMPSCK